MKTKIKKTFNHVSHRHIQTARLISIYRMETVCVYLSYPRYDFAIQTANANEQLQLNFIYDSEHRAPLYTLYTVPFANQMQLYNAKHGKHGLKIHWTNGNDLATAFLLVHDDFAVTDAVNELHYSVCFLIHTHTTHAATMMDFNIVDFVCFFFVFFLLLALSFSVQFQFGLVCFRLLFFMLLIFFCFS